MDAHLKRERLLNKIRKQKGRLYAYAIAFRMSVLCSPSLYFRQFSADLYPRLVRAANSWHHYCISMASQQVKKGDIMSPIKVSLIIFLVYILAMLGAFTLQAHSALITMRLDALSEAERKAYAE